MAQDSQTSPKKKTAAKAKPKKQPIPCRAIITTGEVFMIEAATEELLAEKIQEQLDKLSSYNRDTRIVAFKGELATATAPRLTSELKFGNKAVNIDIPTETEIQVSDNSHVVSIPGRQED